MQGEDCISGGNSDGNSDGAEIGSIREVLLPACDRWKVFLIFVHLLLM
jgi:hypothetical protein